MSSGRPPTRLFAPEDDWFVEKGGGRSPAADDEGTPPAAVNVGDRRQCQLPVAGAVERLVGLDDVEKVMGNGGALGDPYGFDDLCPLVHPTRAI